METFTLSPTALLGAAGALLLLEWLSPWRRRKNFVHHRWLTNLGLMLLGGILMTSVFPADVLVVAGDLHDGRLRQMGLPLALEATLVFLLLDAWRYWEHRLLHEVPLLWRVHLVHHSDTSVDITTGQRHHPLEVLIATGTAFLLLFALEYSAQALAIYLAVASLSVLWTHANLTLPESIDRPLRLWLVTPAVHAVHHSDHQPETDSNYGSVLTLWDRLFGTYTDPLSARIPHFGLAYFHRPADTTLAPVLLQPFEYRGGMSYPARLPLEEVNPAPPVAISPEWQQALRQLLVALAISLPALWPTAVSLAAVWTNSESYQYAWLVLPMFIYVVGWYHRDRILAMTPRPDALGLLVIAGAVFFWSAATLVDIQLGRDLALVLVLQGIFLSVLGRSVYQQLFPIMLMLFMLVPCGDLLQPLLRALTVKWIEWLTLVFDLPHEVMGFMVYVGEHRYVVIDACSGLTFVTLAGFLGYCFGVLLFSSFAKILALAALGAVLGILTNALRVWMIVGIDWLNGSQMDMAAHMDLQWIALLAALGLLFYFTARLSRNGLPVRAPAPARARAPAFKLVRLAPLLAGVLVVAVIAPVQYLAASVEKTSVDQLDTIARRYPGSSWLNVDQNSGRTLLIPYQKELAIVIVEPASTRVRVKESYLHPNPDGGWRHTDTVAYRNCVGAQCVRFVHKTWRRKGSNDVRHALFTYQVGENSTDSEIVYRLASGWNRLRGTGATGRLVGLKVRGELPAEHVLAEIYQRISGELSKVQGGSGETTSIASSTATSTRGVHEQ